jgi:uncharacterized membrane protein YedE/YeeE
MKQLLVAFVSGVLFAAGLAVSGMTDPQKVIGFLDVTGAWDPSLALVMVGAIGVHTAVARWALRARAPLLGSAFVLPRVTDVDGSLVLGAALFGLGWGASGFCPGPALVDLAAPSGGVVAFVASMAIGSFAYQARGLFAADTDVSEKAATSSAAS